jgi:uncharacterized protein (DUF1697 family)
MTSYVALLRAVNVGGTGKLPMEDLRVICERLSFQSVKTYIASGNVVFKSQFDESTVRASLESALEEYAGKRFGVFVRTAQQMASIVSSNPFPERMPNRTFVLFLSAQPPNDLMNKAKGLTNELLAPGVREIYAYYPDGVGASKLTIPAAKEGTARNMNTVVKLAEMASEL